LAKNRDDFTEKTKIKLKDNVGSRCSKPDCRIPTIAKSTNIGKAAHIYAASPGGPRYNSSMTAEERKSIDNGIWLCANHADEIDKDPDRYPVELLHKWKSEAEESARNELGKKLPNDSDAINMATSALTGNPTEFIPNAISNIHQATVKSLEKIDPAFTYKTRHEKETTIIECFAKEETPFSMIINENHIGEFRTKYKKLIEDDKDLKISANAIIIDDWKLLKEIGPKNDANIIISREQKPATLRLRLYLEETEKNDFFDNFQGFITVGSKSIIFQGYTFNKLLTFLMEGTKISMSLSLKEWDGLNIHSLPYFNKIFSLFSKIYGEWKIFVSMDISGDELINDNEMILPNSNFVNQVYSSLKYIDNCRKIAKILEVDILFTSDIEYTAKEFKNIENVLNILEGKEILHKKDLKNNPIINIQIGKNGFDNFQDFIDRAEPSSLEIKLAGQETIQLFNKNIILPRKIICCDSFYPKIGTNINKIKDGAMVKIEVVPEEDFKYSEKYNIAVDTS